jgi:hypothetical protein
VDLKFSVVISVIAFMAPAALGAQRRVEYDISFPNVHQHEARVIATFRGIGRLSSTDATHIRGALADMMEQCASRTPFGATGSTAPI